MELRNLLGNSRNRKFGGPSSYKDNLQKFKDKSSSTVYRLKSVLSEITSLIDNTSEEIKEISSEGDIKAFRIHKEGEKIGLIKAKKLLEDEIKRLEM